MTAKEAEAAVEAAARAVLAHGGPAALTEPRSTVDAIGVALDAGATFCDIEAAMKRIRAAEQNTGH